MISFERTNGPRTEAEVQGLETRLGHPLPRDFRRFVIEIDGGIPEPNEIIAVDGRSVGVEVFLSLGDTRRFWAIEDPGHGPYPFGYLPIGLDVGGNSFLLALTGAHVGSVWFWDHEAEQPVVTLDPLVAVRASFDVFLEDLRPFSFDP